MKTRLNIFYIFTLILFSSSINAVEEVRYYDFEIIIFESLNQEAKISEVWKQDVVLEAPETIVTLGKPYPGPIPKEYIPKYTFKYLPKNSYRLTEEAKLLEADKNYRILLHTAWRQPGMTAETTLPIHIHKEFTITEKKPITPEEVSVVTDPDMPVVNLPTPDNPYETESIQSKAVLDGYLKIVLSRYLHAGFDLLYTTNLPLTPIAQTRINIPEESEESEEETVEQDMPKVYTYHLQQTRKMRSKEVHYIDHPVLGVVILAWPFKLEQ